MIAQATRHIDLSHARHKIIGDAEEAAILVIIRKGGPASHMARQRLVDANLKFVVSVARNFISCGMPMEDLINEGALGMIHAARMYEPATGNRFISYAVWWIRQSILKFLHDHASTIKVPSPASLKAIVDRADEEHRRRRGRPAKRRIPTPDQARAKVAGYQKLRDVQSIDNLMELGWEPVDDHQNPGAGLERRDIHRTLARILGLLKPREREVMSAYFGLGGGVPLTLEEAGQKLSLTRERVRQIKEAALCRLRREVRLEGSEVTF
jgi:RNA polymerase primary sigma factor